VSRTGWPAIIGLVVVVWCGYLWTTTRSTLWDRDEPRNATAAVEMVRSGDLLVPTFNSEPRLRKPILMYWLMALSVNVLGPTVLAVRFWAPLGTAISCLLTAWIARRLYGPEAGWWAAAIFATQPLVLVVGTIAKADAILLPAMLGATMCFVLAWTSGPNWWQTLVMGLLLGVAQLAKGPVGLVVPLLSMLTAMLLARGRSRLGPGYGWHLAAAVMLGVGLFCAWGIPANHATGGAFLEHGIGLQVIGRLIEPIEGHGGTGLSYLLMLPYYLFALPLVCLPWAMLLPASLRELWRRDDRGALLTGMIAAPLVLVTVVATKLPHYILPLMPWLSLAAAGVLTSPAPAPRPMRAGLWLYAALITVLITAAGMTPWLVPGMAPLRPIGLATAGLLSVFAGLAVVAWRRGRHRAAARTLLVGAVLWHGMLAGLWLPALEPLLKVSPCVGRAALAVPGSPPIASFGELEPSVHFSVEGRRIHILRSATEVQSWAMETGPGVLIVHRKDLPALAGLAVQSLDSCRAFDHVHGGTIELEVLHRNPVEAEE